MEFCSQDRLGPWHPPPARLQKLQVEAPSSSGSPPPRTHTHMQRVP